ncbi:MAG: 4Fe-4S dicluster domain-containing protein [Thermodesulfovibrionales bacterium]
MSMDRRGFLKMAGISTVLGLTGVSAVKGLKGWVEASEVLKGADALRARQWGMVVDVRKLSTPQAYKKCIDACHSIHNVPEMPDKRQEIKWIWKDNFEHAFPSSGHHYMVEEVEEQQFLLLCNHCSNPPCVRVCPTKATFKSPEGITMMDFHRCIGCRFCMAACPYGARSFNWLDPRPYIAKREPEFPTRTKGVVEKCNFCEERLAVGKEPACVEASEGALVFGDLKDPNSEVRRVLRTRFAITRKPELGTMPSVYYVIGGGEEHA